jgi:hypothetical protein
MKKARFGFAIGVLLVVMVTGCAAPAATPAPVPTATPVPIATAVPPTAQVIAAGFTPASVCTVPNVVGLDQSMAQGLLAKLGLQPVLANQYDAAIAEGAVISQKPAAGERMEPCKGDVEIVVSLGPIPTLTPRPATVAPPETATAVPTRAVPTPDPCPRWNVAADFQVFPHQENPNRDSCSHNEVWYFMGSSSLDHNPSTYYLLPEFSVDKSGVVGLIEWRDPSGLPWFAFNATGATQRGGGEWPVKMAAAHPNPSNMSVLGWRSPIQGQIRITGMVSDLDPGCGNGIKWFLEKGQTSLAAGYFINAGRQDLKDGLGSESLASVAVNEGDFIYLLIDANGDNICDATFVDFTIEQVP